MSQQLVCLQVHNDYQVPGGETKTAIGIADLLEEKDIEVIRYYKDNKSFAGKNTIQKLLIGARSIYNGYTVSEIEKILEERHVDFALVHNVMPIISNSIYSVLKRHGIPTIKYIQNYNLICLNGALDHNIECEKCKDHCWNGVKNRCYKESLPYSLIRYIAKKNLDNNFLDNISAFMPNSEFVKNKHAEFGMNVEKMSVMLNYIEPDENDEYKENYNSYYLYFGRISKEKGIFTVISAFKMLDNTNLVIMGSGEMENEMQAVIEGQKNISFIGSKKGEDLKEVIRKAKCVIVPSEWDEPLPRTILESYAYGIPVIGSNRGGIPEMIKPGIGYIFIAGVTKDLMEKVKEFESLDRESYDLIRYNCKVESERRYSKDSYYQRFSECLGRLGVTVIKE